MLSLLCWFVPFALAVRPSTPALDAFASAWAKVGAYRATLVMHETSGTRVEDRTYALTFARPSTVMMTVTAGPGRGGRVWWSGGDRVTGSPPGLLSVVKISLPITDPRATSLRGDTVAEAPFGWVLDHLRTTPGTLAQAPVDPPGGPETELTLDVADPAKNDGITREVVDLSDATHLPVEVRRYVGAALVKSIRYADVAITTPSAGGAPTPAP
jgi:hypothetical protein